MNSWEIKNLIEKVYSMYVKNIRMDNRAVYNITAAHNRNTIICASYSSNTCVRENYKYIILYQQHRTNTIINTHTFLIGPHKLVRPKNRED